MREKLNLQNKITKSRIILLLFCMATVFIGIGYASINSVTLDLKGTAIAKAQEGIFITEVNYISSIGTTEDKSQINKYYQTSLNSTITLSETDTKSSITYEIVIYNNSNKEYSFNTVKYLDELYDNDKITYTLDGIKRGDSVKAKETITFLITFKYVDETTQIDDNVLNSYLNFEFKNRGTLKSIGSNSYTGEFWNYRSSITKIVFQDELQNIEGATESWDVSQEGDGTVIAYLIGDDTTYTVYIQGDGPINAPINSAYLFCDFGKLETIENIEYLKTTNVTDMRFMFCNDATLSSLDLSTFDTSNVTNMIYMFNAMYKLKDLKIDNFNTRKVTSMGFMFYSASSLESIDVSKFDTSNVTNMTYMFGGMSKITELDLTNFDTSHVKNMSFMFCAMINLTSLNISSFDTSNVTDMGYMFYSCQKLPVLDLSSFDMSKVTKTTSMLSDMPGVKTAYARTEEDAEILNNITKDVDYTFTVK